MRIITLDDTSMKDILADMLRRDPNNYDSYTKTVEAIVENVKNRRDEAVFEYTKEFDQADLDASNIRVTREEIEQAMAQVDEGLLGVMKKSMDNIRRYHEKQKRNSWFDAQPDGTILGQKVTALSSVGVYVPGGKAAYPSSVLMNIVPAEVAGVKRIVMVTPPGKDGKVNPVTLTAAHLAGATEVYKVGGAQAVAALAFGTQSIPRVNKIVGPGNIFVALAKKAVYGHVSIDSIAGPSEILVIADDSANPRFVAADLLSQAEHDELASAILVTTSMELAKKVSDEVDGFLKVLPRSHIIARSLDNYGYILVTDTMEKAVETANNIAPEHLEIVTANPFEVMTKIRTQGPSLSGNTAANRWGTTLQGQTTSCPPTGQPNSSPPLAWMTSLRSPVSFTTPGRPLKRPIRTLNCLRSLST